MEEFNVSTKNRYQLIDITEKVEEIVRESKIKDGLILVFAPHSTAGIVLTENEEGLKEDWLKVLKKLVSGFDPEGKPSASYEASFQHNRIDDNADSHILSGLVGQGKTLAVKDRKLILGTWQQIFLAEFDGPRDRKIIIEILTENQ